MLTSAMALGLVLLHAVGTRSDPMPWDVSPWNEAGVSGCKVKALMPGGSDGRWPALFECPPDLQLNRTRWPTRNPCYTQLSPGAVDGASGDYCLPFAYLAGPEKTGTTAIFYKLITHPDIAVPNDGGVVKETGFLSNYQGKLCPDLGHAFKCVKGFGDRYFKSLMRQLKLNPTLNTVAIEATPYHLYRAETRPAHGGPHGADAVAGTVKCMSPDARIVVTTRNPTDRTYSDYEYYSHLLENHEKVECFGEGGGATPEHFHEAVSVQVREMRQCLGDRFAAHDAAGQKKCRGVYGANLWETPFKATPHCNLLTKGRPLVSLYPPHVREWLRHFPCDQVLIVNMEAHERDEAGSLTRIANFLGVTVTAPQLKAMVDAKPVNPAEENAFNRKHMDTAADNVSKRRPMLEKTRVLLDEFFTDFWDLPRIWPTVLEGEV